MREHPKAMKAWKNCVFPLLWGLLLSGNTLVYAETTDPLTSSLTQCCPELFLFIVGVSIAMASVRFNWELGRKKQTDKKQISTTTQSAKRNNQEKSKTATTNNQDGNEKHSERVDTTEEDNIAFKDDEDQDLVNFLADHSQAREPIDDSSDRSAKKPQATGSGPVFRRSTGGKDQPPTNEQDWGEDEELIEFLIGAFNEDQAHGDFTSTPTSELEDLFGQVSDPSDAAASEETPDTLPHDPFDEKTTPDTLSSELLDSVEIDDDKQNSLILEDDWIEEDAELIAFLIGAFNEDQTDADTSDTFLPERLDSPDIPEEEATPDAVLSQLINAADRKNRSAASPLIQEDPALIQEDWTEDGDDDKLIQFLIGELSGEESDESHLSGFDDGIPASDESLDTDVETSDVVGRLSEKESTELGIVDDEDESAVFEIDLDTAEFVINYEPLPGEHTDGMYTPDIADDEIGSVHQIAPLQSEEGEAFQNPPLFLEDVPSIDEQDIDTGGEALIDVEAINADGEIEAHQTLGSTRDTRQEWEPAYSNLTLDEINTEIDGILEEIQDVVEHIKRLKRRVNEIEQMSK